MKRYFKMCQSCKFWFRNFPKEGDGNCRNDKAKRLVALLNGEKFITFQSFGCRFYKEEK
jgi:hypothetical protein